MTNVVDVEYFGDVSDADEIDKGNKSSSSYKFRRMPTPLSFYTHSAVRHRVPLFKGNKSSESISSYNTAAVYRPAPCQMGGKPSMDIFLVNEELLPYDVKYLKTCGTSFYLFKNPSVAIHGLRIKYRPAPTAVSKSSDPKIIFGSFGSQSSESKVIESSESKVIFRCFGSQSSESKVSCFSYTSSESKSESKSVAKIISGSFGSQSSESKVIESSESKVIFRCFSSTFSESPSSESKIIFGSFGSQSSESKVIESSKSKVSRNYIPEEVALSILSKLPIKSLKRFGCVCKSWSNLFENTDFMAMYSKHFLTRHGSDDDYHTFIFANDKLELYFLESRLKLNLPSPLQLNLDPYSTCIVGSTSANGIFCIGQENRQKSLYVLWNPLTGEFMEVPPSPSQLTPRHLLDGDGMLRLCWFHGFGYDQLRDDFKVFQYVSFGEFIGGGATMATAYFEIYSSKINSWRMIHMHKDLFPVDGVHFCYPFHGLELYADGACHWLVSDTIDTTIDTTTHVLTMLSFDLSDEVFLTTPIGEEEPITLCIPDRRLTVLNGSIALLLYYTDDIVFHISILGELGVSESWTKLYSYGPFPSIQLPPIGFGKMGYMFFRKEHDEVVCVDLSTQIIEEFGIFTSEQTRSFNGGFIGGFYKESLLSIGGSSN